MSMGNYNKIVKQLHIKKKIKIHILLIQLLQFLYIKSVFKSCQFNYFKYEVMLVLRNSKIVEVHLRD